MSDRNSPILQVIAAGRSLWLLSFCLLYGIVKKLKKELKYLLTIAVAGYVVIMIVSRVYLGSTGRLILSVEPYWAHHLVYALYLPIELSVILSQNLIRLNVYLLGELYKTIVYTSYQLCNKHGVPNHQQVL